MQGDGNTAAHVADDGSGIFRFAPGFAKIAAHDGAGVQRVEEGLAGEFRQAAHMAFGKHLVGHRGIRYIGDALAERGLEALRLAYLVDLRGQIVSNKGGEVAGMLAVTARGQHFTHVGVNVINAGDAGGEEAATAHHDVDIFQFDTLFPKSVHDCVGAHALLVHDVGKMGKFFNRVFKFLLQEHLTILIYSEFRGDGTGVNYEDNTFIHKLF